MGELWQWWAIAGVVFWIIEIFIPVFVTGIFGTASLLVVLLAVAHFPLKIQLLSFVVISAFLTIWIRPIILKNFYRRGDLTETNARALIGKTGPVVDAIDSIAGTGSVKIGGEIWRAVMNTDKYRVDAGQKVIVRGIEGNKVIVDFETETERS
ncbi:MAG: NfeD family protein [Chlorobiaceae bacterium]|nr:NfeD family protein [Chlorobiaceae bacterium]